MENKNVGYLILGIAVALVFGIVIVLGAFYVRHNMSVAEQGAVAVASNADAVKKWF